jgi:hypothetical protein
MPYFSQICECLKPETLANLVLDLHPQEIYKEQRQQAWRALIESIGYTAAEQLIQRVSDQRQETAAP